MAYYYEAIRNTKYSIFAAHAGFGRLSSHAVTSFKAIVITFYGLCSLLLAWHAFYVLRLCGVSERERMCVLF